ncbi:hypothetical protein [Halalkalibacter akibai]|uniref:hypothetical protein n=1 Tax=Halalkalibacter akibai TaxID=1411 RepID=UPI0005559A97|nr:hypothetical protein [Halalkalibacter akibai]
MKIDISYLPKRDQDVYQQLTELPLNEKKLLWMLIKNSNKDHTSMYHMLNKEIRSLIEKEMITKNDLYVDKKRNRYSFFVLQSAPYLMRYLRNYMLRESDKN